MSMKHVYSLIKMGLYCNIADFADALSNPIAYQSQLEKHSEQLAVLEEDFEVEVSLHFWFNNTASLLQKYCIIVTKILHYCYKNQVKVKYW